MAKITDETFKDWQDSEIVTATDYKKEREILRVAANDNDERISSIEESIVGFQLDNAQLTKITNNEGGVKISVTSTSDNILQKILDEGQGMHTFYAVSGSQGLPHTNISIRGIAHFTSNTIGWVWATDYRNNIFTNYYDTTKWSGWKELVGVNDQAKATNLNNMRTRGSFYVDPGTTNSPQPSIWGMLTVEHFNVDSYGSISQTFIDGTRGDLYTRAWTGFVWTNWNRLSSANDRQDELWTGASYMHSDQTIAPIKKLSQCRNGWVLEWSDFDAPSTQNEFDYHYSYVIKDVVKDKWVLFSVPNFISTTVKMGYVGKALKFTDSTITGHDANAVAGDVGSSDVVLRRVLEW